VTAPTNGKRAVVVTGASTGIGLACVEDLIAAGFFVFGSVRRTEDAERLHEKFSDDFAPCSSTLSMMPRSTPRRRMSLSNYRVKRWRGW
jgi:NAD(P)-dependent dehydrogenase (short-subunit alcohol dehydrogenase family)